MIQSVIKTRKSTEKSIISRKIYTLIGKNNDLWNGSITKDLGGMVECDMICQTDDNRGDRKTMILDKSQIKYDYNY